MNLKKIAVLFFIVSSLGLAVAAYSDELSVDLSEKEEYTPSRKLGRGLTNFSCGWMEIFKGVTEVNSHDNLAAALSWGVVKGVGQGAKRTALGVYETTTFPLPGSKKYEPLMEPEFIFSKDTGR